MLIFKKISYSNFLSTGNVPNVIELNKHKSTLITGRNGEGKSTILCALTFALFGKPFRNINKGQLVNSINRKNCLVEIEFSTNGHDYVVKRGIKPNIFEIYCDGQLINAVAAARDYQSVLEQQILKLNYKTFTQVVILGSATFVPFMQLPANQRREVIEDILDIRVFSVMNSILKEKTTAVREALAEVDNKITTQKVKVESQKKLIAALESSKNTIVASLNQRINNTQDAIDVAKTKIADIELEINGLNEKLRAYEYIADAKSKSSKAHAQLSTKIDSCKHNMEFFNTNETCPSCSQHIAEDHKEKILNELAGVLEQQNNNLQIINRSIEKLAKDAEASAILVDAIQNKLIETSTLNTSITMYNNQIQELQREISSAENDNSNITEEKVKMKTFAEEAIAMIDEKSSLLDERQLHDVASALLKDTGIKTAIIREYLPVMNKLINKYLAAMDFYVKFELDESFNEIIRSRNRDEFTYSSFSEGEKRRLDLAILFTWRQIAKMKNSVNTNIMILDEILDGALDTGGIDYFLSIMNEFGDHTNIFVISHKVDQMVDRFDSVVRIEKKNDFSVITSTS
mgnify:CR=1 FL=1